MSMRKANKWAVGFIGKVGYSLPEDLAVLSSGM